MSARCAKVVAEVDAINAVRSVKLRALGKRVRKILLPYFSARQLTYKAGNGDWWVFDLAGQRVDNDDLPAGVRDLLAIEVMYNDYLGYYVDEIKSSHWQETGKELP